MQAFLTLGVLAERGQTFSELQIVLADHFQRGPLIHIWERVSHTHPVVRLADSQFQGSTCFQRSVHAHYANPGTAFVGYEGVGVEHTCPSTLLMAAAQWQRHLFTPLLSELDRQELEG